MSSVTVCCAVYSERSPAPRGCGRKCSLTKRSPVATFLSPTLPISSPLTQYSSGKLSENSSKSSPLPSLCSCANAIWASVSLRRLSFLCFCNFAGAFLPLKAHFSLFKSNGKFPRATWNPRKHWIANKDKDKDWRILQMMEKNKEGCDAHHSEKILCWF